MMIIRKVKRRMKRKMKRRMRKVKRRMKQRRTMTVGMMMTLLMVMTRSTQWESRQTDVGSIMMARCPTKHDGQDEVAT